jgi:hypothetical protein
MPAAPQPLDVRSTLAAFAATPLLEASRAFFDILGYRSSRRLDFASTTEFISRFDPDQVTVRSAAIAPNLWLSVPEIFQLTDSEISGASDGQMNLLGGEFEDKNISAYLFLTLKLRARAQGYSRTELSQTARTLNKLFDKMPVLVLFQHGTGVSLALVERRLNRRDRTRDVITPRVALLKDINCEQPHAAHLRILNEFSLVSLNTAEARANRPVIRTFVDLERAWRRVLSTRELNERFYRDLSAWYHWACGTIRLPHLADYLREHPHGAEENRKQFVIRLLCRTLFCWFLKERRLIEPRLLELHDAAGRPHILFNRPANLTPAQFADGNHYYRGILQNIFFNCLNTPMGERRHSAARAREDRTVRDAQLKRFAYRGKNYLPVDFDYTLFDRIPYLNGGLFDVLHEDNASDTIEDAAVTIPNRLFYATEADRQTVTIDSRSRDVVGLNVLLARYKFTVTENTPHEEEIALDPELLGLVFENLLAEVDSNDPAAAKSARKASGSYYTPRRIIDYMVNEALRLHLENFIRTRQATADEIAALTDLLQQRQPWDATKYTRLADWIVEAFDQLRVLDPACGSGAFPMGALHRMVELLRTVDPGNRLWLNRKLERLPRELRTVTRERLSQESLDFVRKLGLIKDALYGIDIQPLAVLITKLRFFISLLAEQRLDLADATHNYGLTPLPNLETKILCANTLREVEHDLFAREAVRAYQAARDEYYQPTTSAARRAELVETIAEQLSTVLPMFAEEVTGRRERSRELQMQRNRELLKEWFRHSTIPAPFFLFSVFFPEVCPETTPVTLGGELALDGGSGQQELGAAPPAGTAAGFDIVIGNPPYGGTDVPDEVKTALRLGSKDPYGAFLARFLSDGQSPSPLRTGGILAYIVSDTFMTIKTHRPLRVQLMGSRVHKAIRVAGDTFKATVNTAILVVQKGGGPGTTPPAEASLSNAWATGPWCQMVDLTQVSIHDEHERFLSLLFDTAGSERRLDISTESCAVYTYPQALISTNSNLPFFVASPKLFTLMNDTTAPVSHREINGREILVRTIALNGRRVELTKIEQIADVKVGLQTGDNDAYLFQEPEARGSYRDINQFRRFVLSEADLRIIQANPELRAEIVALGISKTDRRSNRYFGGRYIAPYDKGGESDSEGGWMPNYHVPTDYYIDWSEWAVARMKTLTLREKNRLEGKPGGNDKLTSRMQNTDYYFVPGLSWSDAGQYSPTVRASGVGIFDVKGSRMIFRSASAKSGLGFLTGKLARLLLKGFNNHTVSTQMDDFQETPFALQIENTIIPTLVDAILDTQRRDPNYDYASNEQLEIDRIVYETYGLTRSDVSEVETWYARRYPKLVEAQRKNLREAGKISPFEHWNLYCDESCHLPHDGKPYLVLGALACPREQVTELTAALRALKSRHGWPASRESKWTKVSPAGFAYYAEVLDLFLAQPALRFHALIAAKPVSTVPKVPREADDSWLENHAAAAVDYLHQHEAFYYDSYFELLRTALEPWNRYAIYVDVKDTRGGDRLRALRTRLADAHYDFTGRIVEKDIQLIRSHEVELDQLCDLLVGCVSHALRFPTGGSAAKAALINRLQSGIGQSLVEESRQAGGKAAIIRHAINAPAGRVV